jgi:phosphoglucomutase
MEITNNVEDLAKYWATSPVFDADTRKEVSELLENGKEKELIDRFYRDLEFGTGGLRGILGAGTSRMNIFNVRKAACALSRYLQTYFAGQALKVAISYDSRRFSREFAHASAEVLAAHGIKALITKDLRPVPVLSFMVRQYKCHAGICVTASHNPPEYNGFKVYWQTGGQIVPPHDEKVIQEYSLIEDYGKIPLLAFDEALKKGLIQEVGSELDEEYFKRLMKWHLSKNDGGKIKIVYTPLHGTGLFPVVEGLKKMGFTDVHIVPEQREPNGDFPTVKSPNPENPSALDIARKLAEKIDADLILATDPDCDRIGMEIRIGKRFFRPNGNQIGTLLNHYVLQNLYEKKALPSKPLVVKTIVTTDLQSDIAKEYGADCEETLTGFKWICQLIEDYESGSLKPSRQFVCGGEESYGFLADTFVRDKDGIIACCIAAQMVLDHKVAGTHAEAALNQMFLKHGVYHETLKDLTLPGQEGSAAIQSMMSKLRKEPPKVLDGISVSKLKDYKTSREFLLKNDSWESSAEITLPSSNVLQFVLVDGTKVTVRPSGTEPKIKFYVSVKDKRGIGARNLQEIKEECEHRAHRIEEYFISMARSY